MRYHRRARVRAFTALAGLVLAIGLAEPAQAAVRAAPAVQLGTVVTHESNGAILTTHTRVATAADLKTAGYPCCSTYLHAGGVTATSKLTCFKYGITTVCETVFYRSYEACEPYEMGLVYQCQAGQFVFNINVAACGTTCHLGGLYGSHSCNRDGDRSFGYSVDQLGCGDYRIDPSSGTPWPYKDVRQWKQFKICLYTGLGCQNYTFHVDLYRDGGIQMGLGG